MPRPSMRPRKESRYCVRRTRLSTAGTKSGLSVSPETKRMVGMVAKARARAVRRVREIRNELAEVHRAFPEMHGGRRYRRVSVSRIASPALNAQVRFTRDA